MATDAVGEEFITIVPVDEGRQNVKDASFITVLTVGSAAGAAEVIVRRPRGARLGLGLKFEGGSAAAEKVRRLLVQSCAEDSPAANATTPWGKLIPGDEILAIDNVPVFELTRIDCVRRLKDSDEFLKLLVRHFELEEEIEIKSDDVADSVSIVKEVTEIVRPSLPPPVPPRKLGKKNSFKEKQTNMVIAEQNMNGCKENQVEHEKDDLTNGQSNNTKTVTKLSRKSSFDSHLHRQNKEGISCLKKGSPDEIRRLVRRLSDGKSKPPEAEVFIDLLSSEWERCLALADAESDDTGSSISTVVDKLGSMASSLNSIPSTPIMQPKTIDIQKVLNSIENIDSSIYKDITTNKLQDQISELKNENKISNTFVNTSNKQDIKAQYNNSLDDIVLPVYKIQLNDQNNNSNVISKLIASTPGEKDSPRNSNLQNLPEIYADKPKPMPRSSRTDRLLSETPKNEGALKVSIQNVSEPLLTPSKKNCIETWLQRSEAELNNKIVEKSEENGTPEALPRLIDFVPKPQFKESPTESSVLVRPSTAPPPPPTDTREDGSGASLDTIGELDETNDSAENMKPSNEESDTGHRKAKTEKQFWEDRTIRSDNEDKNLSNDEIPLPSCPRQPPDGVETPSDAVEIVPELPSRLPPKLPVGWPNSRKRYSYSSRTQDARSEASVKDKIAMFSNDSAVSLDQVDKFSTLPVKPYYKRQNMPSQTANFIESSLLNKRLTKSQDNLISHRRQSERPEVMGAFGKWSPISSKNIINTSRSSLYDSKPTFYGSSSTLPTTAEPLYNRPIYHTRSISDDNGIKSKHKSNLEFLIEQRKKSMSKLRGLVIPETQGPIADLPEIKVQDPLKKTFLLKPNQNSPGNKSQNSKPIKLNDTKWKTNLLPNNLPKYSPAFKRKSLQVYTPYSLSKDSAPVCIFNEKIDTENKIAKSCNNFNHSKSSLNLFKKNLSEPSGSPSQLGIENTLKYPSKAYSNELRDYKNVEIKICTTTDVVDSDNDSAMSSTQSSYRSSASSPLHNLDSIESDSSRISPRISHFSPYSQIKPENTLKTINADKHGDSFAKRIVCRSLSLETNVSLSSSAGSAATSGSQASCSSLESSIPDTDKKKYSKSSNIDSINRRNILASAKCRSGRDDKLQSPVVENKFSHEVNRSPSPKLKTSDRLSTLTSSVSAIANKGENRRRNKILADTDSDSDCEVSLRQRKAEYKSPRIKRNSSLNKSKQSDTNSDIPKIEDVPKVVSEKIIKENKKTNFEYIGPSITQKDMLIDKVPENKLKNQNSNTQFLQSKDKNEISNSIKSSHVAIISPKINCVADKNKSIIFEDSKAATHFYRLKRGAGTGVGLILAGGTDCEAKDVTIHRVLADSIAEKAGLKRGVKVRSINGHVMTGLTHAQSVAILKEQRAEVVIEIEKEAGVDVGYVSENTETQIQEATHKASGTDTTDGTDSRIITVTLEKSGGGTGLGFGLEGGRDSPHGDCPLTIKKLFAGGSAAECGRIQVGAELLSAGGQSMEGFTRTQAWAALKALPAGIVTLVLKNPR